jgi:epoxide hydrolase-like predicted phosphatase
MIKAVIFDFFGVIGVSTYQLVVDDITLSNNQQNELTDLHRAFDHGFMSEPEFMKAYAQILHLSDEEFTRKYYKAQSKFSSSESLLELVATLRKNNYKVGLLSNVGEDSYKAFIMPIEDKFDVVVTSFHVQLAKPDAAIFEHTVHALGVQPHECVMVDDSPNNCEGARVAGMDAIRYTTYPQFLPEIKALLADFDS